MSVGAPLHFDDDASRCARRPRAFQTIIYGGLIVGVSDFLDATIFSALRGVSPTHVWQFVASGVFSRAAFNGK